MLLIWLWLCLWPDSASNHIINLCKNFNKHAFPLGFLKLFYLSTNDRHFITISLFFFQLILIKYRLWHFLPIHQCWSDLMGLMTQLSFTKLLREITTMRVIDVAISFQLYLCIEEYLFEISMCIEYFIRVLIMYYLL